MNVSKTECNGNTNGVVANNGGHAHGNDNTNGAATTDTGGVANNGHVNGNGIHRLPFHDGVVVNLDRGDPKMYYPFWRNIDERCAVTIKASELMSYFADVSPGGVFYQMPEFATVVKKLHCVVGNAAVEGRYIIAGTGSSQLFTVALRALAATVRHQANFPLPVVCAEPFYSCYQEALEEEKSEVYQWRGDAKEFKEEGPYVEVVTSPNNPDGTIRKPVVNREGGMVIADLAYCWPQYTPITASYNYEVMLFTLSKCTGHAGSRVGWAIVKDREVAMNMIKQMSLMTIGSCREGQLRATKILDFVATTYQKSFATRGRPFRVSHTSEEGLFEFGRRVLAERWAKLRSAVKHCGLFKLLEFPAEYCNFICEHIQPNPAYAWMECVTGEDAAELLEGLNIKTRNGQRFGASPKYTRVSMLESDETFDLFIERLLTL